MRDARREASDALGPGFDPRVLEPSPPAVATPPLFADDPLESGDVLPVVRVGARTWADVVDERGDAALAAWCADRWLVSRTLDSLPLGFAATRESLHAVAAHVLCPARHRVNGKIGLRFTYRGFGTPFFGADDQLRIEDGVLVRGDERLVLTTIAAAAAFAGIEPGAPTELFSPTTSLAFDAPLDVDPVAARALGDFYGFTARLLEQLRADAGEDDAAGRVQLWPEHFDMAVDLGRDGARANFGGSPGDSGHAGPYLYVGPWDVSRLDRSGFWNEPFGASLSYRAILEGADPLAFLREGRDRIQSSSSSSSL